MHAQTHLAARAESLAIGYAAPLHPVALNFVVHRDETLCILGPNGAGKTTLLRTLLGLVPPLRGQVLLGATPVATMGDAQRARALAYVPQAMDVALDRSALDVVVMGRAPHLNWYAAPSAGDLSRARESLQRLGIESLATRSYARMSAGERQLTLIARALAQDARLIVLDEPAAHLDLGNQERVLETLAGLAAQGRSVVFSSHHPQHAATAGRVLLLGRDGIAAHGVPREVLDAQRLRALYNLRSDKLVSGLAIP